MPPITRSVVRRRNWRWSPGNEHTPRGWVCFPGPGTAVADFDTFDAAEAEWGKRESAVRLKMNPFECGPLPMVSSLPDPILRDFLMDTGIEPPAPGIAWDAWWTANREQLSDEQRARVWQAADKVRFFEITEEAIGPEVHVVVDVTWEERVGIYVADWDGGELIRACRSPQRAGEISRDRSQQSRIAVAGRRGVDGPPFANCRPCNVPDPFTPGSTRLLRLPQVPFSEVLTIPYDDTADDVMQASPFPPGTWLNRNERLGVLLRLDYSLSQDEFQRKALDFGVPIKAFADWDKAQSEMRILERAARATFNPFLLAQTLEWRLGYQSGQRLPTRLLRLCRGHGVSRPRAHQWASWWITEIAPLSESQREPFWAALDQVRFYSVISVPFEA